LARSWWLVVLLDVLRWRLLGIWILGRRRPPVPLVWPRETVLRLLVLGMLTASHVGTRFLGRWRRKRGGHLEGGGYVSEQVQRARLGAPCTAAATAAAVARADGIIKVYI
jgi:hypothetical protein